MPVLSSALLRLVWLAAPLEAFAPPACEAGTPHLELAEDTPGEALAVCIHPGLSTNFFFDTKLTHVKLTGQERFRVIADETGLALMPTRALAAGERVPLTVSFQEGSAPAGVTFSLVVHPSEAARQVEVTHRPRTLAAFREGEQQAREEARRCREEKARLEEECGGKGGLLGLLAQGWLGEDGIASRDITKSITSRPGNTLTSTRAHSYRSDPTRLEDGRVVVRLRLKNHGSTPWMPGGAVLVGPKGEEWKALGVWTQKPLAPGEKRDVGMEVEVPEEAARGTFTLKVWGQEAGSGSEHFDGVTFP